MVRPALSRAESIDDRRNRGPQLVVDAGQQLSLQQELAAVRLVATSATALSEEHQEDELAGAAGCRPSDAGASRL